MASPKVFAMRIARRARQVETGAPQAVRALSLIINQVIVSETPVKSGHARANWQIGISEPITSEIDEEDPSGSATIERNASTIKQAPPHKDIILSNNVPYIHKLNEGSSSQAPAQFVQIAVAEAILAAKKTRFFR